MTALVLLWAQGTQPAAQPLAPVPGHPGFLGAQLPPFPPVLSARVLQYAEARSAVLRDVSDDGRTLLVATQLGPTEQLHRVSQPLGMREQLTFLDAPASKAAFLPQDASTLFYLQAPGGGAFYQLWRLDLRTGRSELLTDGKSHHETFVLSPEGRWIAYSGTDRNGKDTDVYLAEVANARAARRLTELDGRWLPLAFSPDGGRLLLAEGEEGAQGRLWLLDIATGARRRLWGEARVHQALFAPDGKALYLLLDEGDFTVLRRLALSPLGAAPQRVLPDVNADVEEVAVAADGTLVFSTNEAGYSRAYLLRGQRAEPLPLPPGVLHGLRFAHGKSDVLFLSLEGPTSPTDVWALSLKTKKLVRWTKSELGGLDARTLVAPKLLHYQADDGVALSAFLYLPREVPSATRVPVVLSFHDGPDAQERPGFRWEYQLLLEQGLAVLAPNVRGSDGFGQRFRALDDGVLREQVLKDIAATLAVLARQPELDASRVAVWGEGYGGYLALVAAASFPDAFCAVVDVCGMASLPSFLESAPPYRRAELRQEYGDERMPEVRRAQERLSAGVGSNSRQPPLLPPLLVVHGKRDSRVSEAQAQALLKGRGRDGWYLLALDEGRGFWRKEAKEVATLTLVLFLSEKLRQAPAKAAH
ncbi:MAG: prolyl oligopeptidase family serine peptidase [Myxococcaceae bacterium]